MSVITVADIERAIAERFPWNGLRTRDRCGLLVEIRLPQSLGDTGARSTLVAIEATAGSGGNVLVTHHPAFLAPPSSMRPGRGAEGVVFAAASARSLADQCARIWIVTRRRRH
jgi:hypothetical protein